ncbi:MAG: electron transfer flavoprotein subunit beta/FixA family protein [Thermoplasmata archaeon]|nr:electron transfer flavoprotein subunit beta/FixA family protein [Thermoplasmata archaeon]
MEMIVCIKQVPDTNDVRIDEKKGTLIREGVPSIINPDDRHAIEEALRIREAHGGRITVLSMGPPQADDALREALAMGVDEAVLLTDRAFAGSDTWATAYSLGKAVQALGDFDLIIAGRQAIDGDTAQVGPQMADYLGLPQVTYVRKVKVGKGRLTVERALEDGHEILEIPLPALITVIGDLNEPRYPSVRGIVTAYREKEVKTMTAADLGADPEKIGLKGSPTQVKKTFVMVPKRAGEKLEGSVHERVDALIGRLRDRNALR